MVAFFGGSGLVVLLLTLCAGCGSDAGWVPYTVCGVLCAGSCPYPPLSIMFELDAAGWRVLGVVSHEWFSLFWLVTVVGCSRFLCSAFLG